LVISDIWQASYESGQFDAASELCGVFIPLVLVGMTVEEQVIRALVNNRIDIENHEEKIINYNSK